MSADLSDRDRASKDVAQVSRSIEGPHAKTNTSEDASVANPSNISMQSSSAKTQKNINAVGAEEYSKTTSSRQENTSANGEKSNSSNAPDKIDVDEPKPSKPSSIMSRGKSKFRSSVSWADLSENAWEEFACVVKDSERPQPLDVGDRKPAQFSKKVQECGDEKKSMDNTS